MLNSISSPFLKGMVDTIPLAVEGENLADYFEQLQDDFIHIHFIDGNPGGHLAWEMAACHWKTILTPLFIINITGRSP